MKSIAVHTLLAVGLMLALAPAPATAIDCLDYSGYPHWIAHLETDVPAADLVIDGGLAYVAVRSAGVVVVDISDPAHPVQVGALDGDVAADKLLLTGDHLFAADGVGRLLHVLDVSDPTAPVAVTQVPTGIYPRGLALAGNHLYVAVQNDGVMVLDLTDPAAPLVLGTLPSVYSYEVTVADGLLFVNGTNFGLDIYDLADPAAPGFLIRVQVAGQTETWGTAVRGNYAYVIGPFGMWILDVSQPEETSLVGSPSRWATDITIVGDHAYLATTGVEILNLTDPENPVPVTFLPEPAIAAMSWVKSVAIAGDKIFAAADDVGLMVGDLPQIAAPPRTTALGLPATAERLRLWNDFALVADGVQGLLVVDVADPTDPSLVGALATEDARAVITDGDLAYLADGGDGLKIIDLAVPTSPLQIGHLDTYSRVAMGLDLAGDLVYMAADMNDLMIIDVTDPTAPYLVAQVATPSRSKDVCVDGNYAYVADDESGLQVVDVSDPEAPFIAASVALPGRQQSVIRYGTTLFTGGLLTGLWALDIAAPTAPQVLGWLPIEAHDLARDGDVLLAAGGDGVNFIDCSDPSAMVTRGFLPTVEECVTVAVGGGFAVAAGDSLHAAGLHCEGTSGIGEPTPIPLAWARLEGHPNPFNPRIEIEFELAAPQRVRLEVVDLAGRRVMTLDEGRRTTGTHRASWEGRDQLGRAMPSGTYFLVLRGDAGAASRKVTLIR